MAKLRFSVSAPVPNSDSRCVNFGDDKPELAASADVPESLPKRAGKGTDSHWYRGLANQNPQ